jgi:dTDP-4-amino-4,6-dideoxygalactose transaminase
VGDLACFSFYPSKNLGALGDGGAVVTDDDALARRLRQLRNHDGVAKSEHLRVGTNSRLDALQAAVLSAKLPDLDARNARRRELAACYERHLAGADGVDLPDIEIGDAEQVFHLYVIRVPARSRDALAAHLRSRGVHTGVHYPAPVHLTEAFGGVHRRGAFPAAEQLAGRILSLPMYPELREEQVASISRLIRAFIACAPTGAAVDGP